MANKRSRQSGASLSPQADDFKSIRGISPAIESRLHQAGVLTYAQLAALSPEEILKLTGDISGLTAGRITRQNWAGRARDLSGRSSEAKSPEEPGKDRGWQYSSFATELRLDAGRHVILTRVMNIQTGDEEIWGGWDEKRFVGFFAQHAALKELAPPQTAQIVGEGQGAEEVPVESLSDEIDLNDPNPARATEQITPPEDAAIERRPGKIETHESVEANQVSATEQPPPLDEQRIVETGNGILSTDEGVVNQRDHSMRQGRAWLEPDTIKIRGRVEILPGDPAHSSRMLPHNRPFGVRLHLDLSDLASSSEEPLVYFALVQARNLGGHLLRTIQARGSLESKPDAALNLNEMSLIPGTYRLAAEVTVRKKDQKAVPPCDLKFHLDGGLLQIY